MCQLVLSVYVYMGYCELIWYSQLTALSKASANFPRCLPELLRAGFPRILSLGYFLDWFRSSFSFDRPWASDRSALRLRPSKISRHLRVDLDSTWNDIDEFL